MRHYWNLRDSISVENGVLFYESRIVVPKELRSKVLRLVHEGHNGVTKTNLRAKQLVYWKAMDYEIKYFIDMC